MLKEERLKIILREVNLYNRVLSTDLSEKLKVSEDTIRRDLNELSKANLINRVHGGAISKSLIINIENKETIYALNAKLKIAEKAISLLKNNQVILIEGGTTIQTFAKKIPKNIDLHFFTISPQTSIELAKRENVTVDSIGGQLRKDSYLYTGSSVINQLKNIRANLCIMGANGFSVNHGLSDIDWEIVQEKKTMIECSNKTIVMCISEKLNNDRKYIVSPISQIDYLITELDPNSPILRPFVEAGINVI